MGYLSELQLVFLLAGATLLVISIFFYVSTRKFLAKAKSTSGKILDNLRDENSEGSTTYKPRFSFAMEDGREVVVQSETGTSSPFRKEQTVTVLYDPAKPEDARINTFVQLWLATVICAALGFIFAIVGCFIR
jgi:predicted membrane channel-forming protein YqfA (hemolysin III family)